MAYISVAAQADILHEQRMNMKFVLFGALGVFLLSSCGKEETTVDGGGGSSMEPSGVVLANDGVDRPLLDDAQKHLRFGGDYYAYTYVGDSYEGIADAVDEFITEPFFKETTMAQGKDTDVRSLLDWTGLGEITAMGASSHSMGDIYETRRVVVVDDMSRGIWPMLGEPRPALSANAFASDVSIAMDIQLDLRSFRSWIQETEPMAGKEALSVLNEALEQGVGKKTAGEIIDAFNGRLAIGVVLHSGKQVEIPLTEDETLELPDVDLIVCAEGFTENFDELRTLISSQEQFEKVELPNGVTGYAVKAENLPPLPMEGVRPVIAYDVENNRIFLSSRPSYLEKTLSSAEKLKDSPDYATAMKGLPTDVISTIYFSKQAGGEIDALLTRVTENNPQTLEQVIASALTDAQNDFPGLTTDKTLALIDKLDGMRKKFLGNAWLSVSSVDGNAIYSVTRMPLNGRPLMLGGGGYASTLVALTTTSTLFIGAKAWKDGADRSHCILNIRNMQVAVRSWSGMNSKRIGDPIDMSEIVGPGKFIEAMPVCPAGGTYRFMETIPEVGETVMKCSIHDHEPNSTVGW